MGSNITARNDTINPHHSPPQVITHNHHHHDILPTTTIFIIIIPIILVLLLLAILLIIVMLRRMKSAKNAASGSSSGSNNCIANSNCLFTAHSTININASPGTITSFNFSIFNPSLPNCPFPLFRRFKKYGQCFPFLI